MSWCTSGVGLQVLPFIDNRHLGSMYNYVIMMFELTNSYPVIQTYLQTRFSKMFTSFFLVCISVCSE